MKSIFELAYRYIEPSIKRSLVERLLARGMRSVDVAKCLGLSLSLVSRYARRERGLQDFMVYPDVAKYIEKLADRVFQGEVCGISVYKEILMLTLYILGRKYACSLHYAIDRDINPASCRLCPDLVSSLMSGLLS
ncbi:MAG: XRE family transcriptional regulator [Thermosphaera sp.]